MISLRQHAISLAAVFLALAIGVVLGSGFFSDTLLSSLRNEKRDLAAQITGLTDQRNALNEKLAAANTFDNQVLGRIVHDALAGKAVVIFRTPDANDDDVAMVSKIVGQAGGSVTGTVSLTQEFVEANSAEKLRSVVNSSILPAGTQLSTKLVDQGSQAGDLLGIALLSPVNPANPPAPPVDDAQRDTVLAALRETGFITYQPADHFAVANAGIVITGGGLPADAGNQGPAWRGSPLRWRRTVPASCSPAGMARRPAARPSQSPAPMPVWPPPSAPSTTSTPRPAASRRSWPCTT
ncbi:hypothetical protein I546_4016 [Mycobacterium kansasii 732]|nr:hypothetical protein I546_4016 [Mycobacterium kansasii 732]